MRFPLFLLTVALALPFVATPAIGQVEESPEGAYSRGAGAYFAGRTTAALEQLSQAIEFAPSDPRGYYLRGLTFVKLGDLAKAHADLAEGARLEAAGGTSSAFIDRSLASVQGPSRTMLERIRREARRQVKVDQRVSLVQSQRRARQEREKRVLRTTFQLPMETLISQLTPAQAQRVAIQASNAPDDPFADDGSVAATTEAVSPKPDDVDIPEEARGSVSVKSLFSIFGRTAGNTGRDLIPAQAREAVEGLSQGPMGGGPPGAGFGEGGPDAGGFEQGGFEEGGMEEGGFDGFSEEEMGAFGDDSNGDDSNDSAEPMEMEEEAAGAEFDPFGK